LSVQGAFTFVLHSHLPYTRLPSRWPQGNVWIHEVVSESIIPLLQTLYQLQDERIPFALSLCLTPMLVEQLTNPQVVAHFNTYLDERIAAARADSTSQIDSHVQYLAAWYEKHYQQIKASFNDRFERDLIGAFRRLQDAGLLEVVASAATHAYLPLLGSTHAQQAQIRIGVESYERHFGRKPRSFWLPECAYEPGIERLLAAEGVRVFFAEPHMFTNSPPIGVAAGDVLGPFGLVKQRYVIPQPATTLTSSATTFEAYYVGQDPPNHSGVAVIGRDDRTTTQVWGALVGYPRDVDYREPHRQAGTSGLHYWRVTGELVDYFDKDFYHPEWAAYKYEQHAEHYAHLVGDMLREHARSTEQFGLVSAHFDTRLFGQWWFEGSHWLGQVLRHLANTPTLELTTASRYIEDHPPQQVIDLQRGSWGTGGSDFIWDNPETHWMWSAVHEAETRMIALANRFTDPTPDEATVLNQAAREVLLLQSADWAYLITTGLDREYAIQHFSQYLRRFENLASSLEEGKPARELAAGYWEVDQLFSELDYRVFIES
jgi:1,4-alpha-glucan branching enzyme